MRSDPDRLPSQSREQAGRERREPGNGVGRLGTGMTDAERLHWYRTMASKRSRTVLTSGGLAPVMDAERVVATYRASMDRKHIDEALAAMMELATAANGETKTSFERANEGAINPALWPAMTAYRKALTEKPVTVR